jgi:hypothetical protein
MTRIGLLAALVMTPVALAAPGPTAVTIAAQPTVVVYGTQTMLSGKVAPAAQHVKVTVYEQACGSSSLKAVTTAQTIADGSWTTIAKPNVRTDYQAKAKSATSTKTTVQVRPYIVLQKVGPHKFHTEATAGQSLDGRVALFQRRTSTGWKTVKSVVLKTLRSGPAPTVVTAATFTSGITKRHTVRIFLTHKQVGACYLPGSSNTLRT